MSRKILSVILSVIIIFTCVSPINAFALDNFSTTQGPSEGVFYQSSLTPYSEFNSKSTDGAFYIPGLNNTVSFNNEFKCYSPNSTMVPQAMCTVDHFTLITAYDGENAAKSVIYVLDYNKTLVKTLIMPDSYHVGGIAYDSVNKVILITKASKGQVGVITADDFYRYLTFNSPFIKIDYSIAESKSNVKASSASGVTYRNGRVYLSSFGTSSGSAVYCYIPTFDSISNSYYLTYQYKFTLPNYTQGVTIADYKGKTRLFASISYGRSEKKRIYCSYLYTYVFDEATGNKTFDNILTCPPMLQQTYAKGGKLYCLFESAAALYKSENKNPVDVVIPIRLSKICDEKYGNNIDVSVGNSADGKLVNITANIPNAKIYYSSGMPYVSYNKITNAYSYSKSYVKTNSSMVYAVAVVDGKIVASDAVFVTLKKASAPSKPKITAKSKSAVNITWTKASNASGYYIYRSTKKSGKYVKVGIVKGNKNRFKDRKVKSKKTYYYKVKAYRNGYTNSSLSASVSVKTK